MIKKLCVFITLLCNVLIAENENIFDKKIKSWVNPTEALQSVKQMSKYFNCQQNNHWLQCLRKVFSKLIHILNILYNVLHNNSVINNVVDIKTTSGLVRGQTIDVFGQRIDQFLGIPFAEPPVGNLRFRKPKSLKNPKQGIIDATKPGPSCMQIYPEPSPPLNMSEDCLVLNIWSAQTTKTKSTQLKPVMFWIYGGGLLYGSIFELPLYNGSILATHDVVIVTTNYRVGPFGNLYAGMKDSPANLGFFDQLLALKWVRENIHLFGGDNNQITIFGVSSGGWSVSAHILSPLSRGLFRRAIMESGAILHNKRRSWVNTTQALQSAKQMSKHFNCTQNNYWLQCLQKVDANKITAYNDNLPDYPLDGTEFLPIFAQEAFIENIYNQEIDLMAGVVEDEGTSAFYMNEYKDMFIKPNFTILDFKSVVNGANDFDNEIDVKIVENFYLKNVDKNNSPALRKASVDLIGDFLLKCPTYLFAKQFSKYTPNRKTFFYEFTYAGAYSECSPVYQGVCHQTDVNFEFGVPILMDSGSKFDIDFSREVIKMWTNFAKTGNPGSNWPLLSGQGSSKIKNLNPYDLDVVLIDPFKKTCEEFWKNYFL